MKIFSAYLSIVWKKKMGFDNLLQKFLLQGLFKCIKPPRCTIVAPDWASQTRSSSLWSEPKQLFTKSLVYRIIPGEEFRGNEERGSDSRSFKDGERDLEWLFWPLWCLPWPFDLGLESSSIIKGTESWVLRGGDTPGAELLVWEISSFCCCR